jgi:hypothetical protein
MAHVAVASQVALSGNAAEASAGLERLVIVGWHLQQDLSLLANLVGMVIGARIADELAGWHTGLGDVATAQRWKAYAVHLDTRRAAQWPATLQPILQREGLPTVERVEALAALTEDPGFLPGFRVEAGVTMCLAHMGNADTPPPFAEQTRRWRAWKASDDPVLREIAVYAEGFLTLDAESRAAQRAAADKALGL